MGKHDHHKALKNGIAIHRLIEVYDCIITTDNVTTPAVLLKDYGQYLKDTHQKENGHRNHAEGRILYLNGVDALYLDAYFSRLPPHVEAVERTNRRLAQI